MTVKSIDILGNGNSNNLYEQKGQYTIACNVPQHGIGYNALSIIDTRPLDYMKQNKWRAKTAVFCTPQVRDYATKTNIEGDWFPVYEKKHRWNSGHHAVLHHSTMTNSIHLWGFDSLFSDDLTSQCDTIITRYQRPPLNKNWHPIWIEILDQIDCEVFLHIPEGEKCSISHDKLVVLEHPR